MIREELEKLVSSYTANIHSRTIEELAQKEKNFVDAILSKIGTIIPEEKDSPSKQKPVMKADVLNPMDGQIHMQNSDEVFIFKSVKGEWEWLEGIKNKFGPPRGQLIDEFIEQCISSGKCVENTLNLTWQESYDIERSVNDNSDKIARRVLNRVLTRVRYE
jgi:hypothetical protein